VTHDTDNYVQWFRHAAPYINAHRGKTFVIMLPGDCVDNDNFGNIINDIGILNSLGVRLVVVHGARSEIQAQLAAHGVSSNFHHGLRVTPKDDMPHVMQAVGATRVQLEASFSAGLPSSPLHGARIRVRSGNFVTAMPQGVIDGVDLQHTGKVRSVDRQALAGAIEDGAIALVSPLGYSATGEVFNLSFADVAISIAATLQADKLIAYNDDGPIYDKNNTIYREMTLLKCEKFLVEQPQHSRTNTYFALRACYRACDGGVSRAHVISATEDGALLKELFTRDGSGTMVYRDSYETLRRANIDDVMGILGLIEPLEREGVLVKRSRELLEKEINSFTVMEKDNVIIGCAALYPFADAEAGELACVAVHKDYRRGGRAAKLLHHVERQAQRLGLQELYVLTTQTAHWFLEQGFEECGLEQLPAQRKELYNFERRSKVFFKRIKK
jgi:amino-acid N-acetyltransferase